MSTQAMNIPPEIIAHIAKYLKSNDQVHCLQVCKAFHDSFIPFVWRTIHLRSSQQQDDQSDRPLYPTGSVLQRYKTHIQELHFLGVYPTEYLEIQGCLHLQGLVFTAPPHSSEGLLLAMAQFLELVKAYSSTLRSLIFHTRLSAFTNPWSALATCPKLDKLDLKGVTVQSQDWTLFSQVSTNVHHLSLTNIDLLQESIGAIDDATIYTCIGNNTSPPRLRKLTLEGLLNTYSGQFPNEIVALIRMCHDLESLRWRTYKLPGGSGNFPSVRHINGCACPKLFNELLKSPWPLTALKSLDISHACLEDEEMASLLDRIRQLKTLKMSSTLFGPLSLQALTEERRALTRDGISGLIISQPRRLCNSIKFLNTDNCRNVTGTMIQTILESCPDLRGLSAGKVTVTEMAQGQSWACSKLEQLTIFLVADDDGDKRNEAYGTTSVRFMRLQQLVFERLNTLTNLQKLVLTNDRVRRRELRRIKTLDLRVDAGLGILTNLKNLRTLYFKSDIPQMMDIEEAVWIAKHWPRLSYMVGPWNQDKAVCHSMNKILKYVRNREPDRHK